MKPCDFPHWLSDDECDTLLANWDRFLVIETTLLSASANPRNQTSTSIAIDNAVRWTLSEAAWKKSLLQRQAARANADGNP
ncbi:MAG: hypothetical protein Q8O14_14690 [bacterium]|nr:hypothetical protein [bacterium]